MKSKAKNIKPYACQGCMLGMILVAYLHCSSLDQCKHAYLDSEGLLWKLTITVSSHQYYSDCCNLLGPVLSSCPSVQPSQCVALWALLTFTQNIVCFSMNTRHSLLEQGVLEKVEIATSPPLLNSERMPCIH